MVPKKHDKESINSFTKKRYIQCMHTYSKHANMHTCMHACIHAYRIHTGIQEFVGCLFRLAHVGQTNYILSLEGKKCKERSIFSFFFSMMMFNFLFDGSWMRS